MDISILNGIYSVNACGITNYIKVEMKITIDKREYREMINVGLTLMNLAQKNGYTELLDLNVKK
jgi:hypothetical protein